MINQVLTHCKAMLYRKTYGSFSLDPMTDQVKSKYGNLFAMTNSCAYIVEEAWFIQLNDDNIAYLTIHLGGALNQIGAQNRCQPKVSIVCDEGSGSRKFLLWQCQRYMPQARIEALFTSQQYNSVPDIVAADVVIATSDGLETKLQVLVDNPVLTN